MPKKVARAAIPGFAERLLEICGGRDGVAAKERRAKLSKNAIRHPIERGATSVDFDILVALTNDSSDSLDWLAGRDVPRSVTSKLRGKRELGPALREEMVRRMAAEGIEERFLALVPAPNRLLEMMAERLKAYLFDTVAADRRKFVAIARRHFRAIPPEARSDSVAAFISALERLPNELPTTASKTTMPGVGVVFGQWADDLVNSVKSELGPARGPRTSFDPHEEAMRGLPERKRKRP